MNRTKFQKEESSPGEALQISKEDKANTDGELMEKISIRYGGLKRVSYYESTFFMNMFGLQAYIMWINCQFFIAAWARMGLSLNNHFPNGNSQHCYVFWSSCKSGLSIDK